MKFIRSFFIPEMRNIMDMTDTGKNKELLERLLNILENTKEENHESNS